MKIKRLNLYTKNLDRQIEFYEETLGLEILDKSDNHVVILVGQTELQFEQNEQATPYHFAVNIPSFQEDQALEWIKSRMEVVKDGDNQIQDFNNWNAKAVYFYDGDNNIVEFIARKNLNIKSDDSFSRDSLIAISEIGMPVSDLKTAFQKLNEAADLRVYDGSFERFCAVGDEHGLFICVNYELKDWFPTGDKAFASNFEIEFEQNGNAFNFIFQNERIRTQN